MIHIVLKVRIRPEQREKWLSNIREYTEAVRAEPGSLSFDCYESIETPDEYAIVEGFASPEAGEAHVRTAHFKDFMGWFPTVVAGAPKIINTQLEGGWSEMAELG